MNPYEIIKEAVFTERSTAMSEKQNVYTFNVVPDANKLQIKEAVETAFEVNVVAVRTLVSKPKRKIDRYRGIAGKSAKVKKALVTVKAGQSIELV